MYDAMDNRNNIILKPRGGPPPPSIKTAKLGVIMKFIPPDRMTEMAGNFLQVFGHIAPKKHFEGPQPCSMDDYADIKNAINYYNVN